MENFAETIRKIQFFSGLSREDLARVVAKLEEEKYLSGETIVRQGDPGNALYVVQSGAVEVVLESDGLGVESLAILSANECFGEMALFTGEKRSATVRAFVDSVVLKISQENWQELLSKYPSLSLHFCKVLSRRLAETDRDVSKGRGAFNLVMEEFLAAQPSHVQDFLIQTSILGTLDVAAIQSVLSLTDPSELLVTLSSNYPPFLQIDSQGYYTYRRHLRDFLNAKLSQTLDREKRNQLHARFASYFSSQGQWLPAVHHSIKAEAWPDAVQLIKAHGRKLVENAPPAEMLMLLDALPAHLAHSDGYLAQLRAEVYAGEGDFGSAIRSYQEYLGHKEIKAGDAIEMAQYYQGLAELHQKKGEVGEALGCLRMGATMVENGTGDLDAVEALRSIELLQERSGTEREALSWGSKALKVIGKLKSTERKKIFNLDKRNIGIVLALMIGWSIWQMTPPPPLDERGVRFLATLTGTIILWAFEVFDEHVVATLLLFSWLVLAIVPAGTALAGFSQVSWFFALGVLGMGAAVTKSGLLYRLALQVLRRLPSNYKIYTSVLSISGLLVTPLFPQNKGRIGMMAPLTQTISEAMGFTPRSNGSAGLAFSSFIGFSQLSFVYLTGATVCLVGWNLLPENAKASFGWGTWLLAALPGGLITLFCLFAAIHLLFPVGKPDGPRVATKTVTRQMEVLGPLTANEWISVFVLVLAVIGWIGKPFHGIDESVVALGAFAMFLVTGLLDKRSLKNNIDWGYLLFLGVVSGLANIMPELNIDRWFEGYIASVLSSVTSWPAAFLTMVACAVYGLRFFLKKPATVVLLLVTLTHLAQENGIHPGVLLLTILMAIESWFLPYQTDSYQIAYYSTDEKAFSHAQGRKLMLAKFIASILAITLSVPYWTMMGLIR